MEKKVLANTERTPKKEIVEQMNEKRPLPIGRQEFEEWSDRIISGALLPGGKDDPEAFLDEQKRVLCGMIMHCGPTESHKEDAFFIHSLRKNASNFTATAIFEELKQRAKEKIDKRLAEEAQKEQEKLAQKIAEEQRRAEEIKKAQETIEKLAQQVAEEVKKARETIAGFLIEEAEEEDECES